MKWAIYCHTHVESGRRYIGLTKKTMLFRWNQHVSNAKKKSGKGCHHFWNAIRKYGKDAFSHEVLEVCHTLDVANLAEECWIELLETRDPSKGFNLAKGGAHGALPHVRKNPWDDPEYRQKSIEASRRTWSDPARKAAISAAHMGVKLSPEHCAMIAESRIGKDHSSEVRSKINDSVRATYSRPEIREKNSIQSKRSWSDPLYRKKVTSSISASMKKKWSDPNYRKIAGANISAVLKEKWASESPPRPTQTETHKICREHGSILFRDCYTRVRSGRTYFECRECYRVRNRKLRGANPM